MGQPLMKWQTFLLGTWVREIPTEHSTALHGVLYLLCESPMLSTCVFRRREDIRQSR